MKHLLHQLYVEFERVAGRDLVAPRAAPLAAFFSSGGAAAGAGGGGGRGAPSVRSDIIFGSNRAWFAAKWPRFTAGMPSLAV